MESALLGERLNVKKREATRLDDLVSSVANAGAGWDVRISATLRLGREFDSLISQGVLWLDVVVHYVGVISRPT